MNSTPDTHAPGATWLPLAVPVLLMLATRMDHFGSALRLPDASLAAFFFAGLLLRGQPGTLAFPFLCALAGAIDYWAITEKGVSAFCVTPAYGFLLPTYFALWWAGRTGAHLDLAQGAGWLRLGSLATLAVLTAFVISNGSFYLFSGYVTTPGIADYLAGVARYLPHYAGYGLGYIALGLVLYRTLGPGLRHGVRTHG
ncbi:MAG TPA: hypothetical protein VK018_04980 [Porticoccaceae bacterium]|jgi:hypothetical protein|nr:hypothetical protein [Pseudomonadota bacterium]HLS98056.1 hypothetical protein [Porticoccaceae bacterium]